MNIPVNKDLLTGTHPVNKELLTRTVPVNKDLLTGSRVKRIVLPHVPGTLCLCPDMTISRKF